MRKALIPMLASLALCGAATAALVATNARAAPTNVRKPVMVALVAPGAQLAQNDPAAAGHAATCACLRRAWPRSMKQMCEDRYAREAGRMAYLEARLQLRPARSSRCSRAGRRSRSTSPSGAAPIAASA